MYEKLPEQLKKDGRFCLWKYEERNGRITNIFGKSIEDLVMDGMRNKITLINEESQVKLQDSMQKIVNDSNGGLVCIII